CHSKNSVLTHHLKTGKSIISPFTSPQFFTRSTSPLSQNRERVSAQVQPFGSIEFAHLLGSGFAPNIDTETRWTRRPIPASPRLPVSASFRRGLVLFIEGGVHGVPG